ncbi:putative dynamin GTPase [Annulohypoxylon bovei var. microspora]|nr:putative dynamin GTPase [Annulohypoxylon bovei var. microspora]
MKPTDIMTIKEEYALADGLGSAWLVRRLEQIDKVRANGVGDTIPLPRLVVCGDQSSGKSSVLERLTGIPFPQGDGICTRFPIEIVFRHTHAPQQITAGIRSRSGRSPELRQTLEKYHRKLSDISELSAVIDEVASLLHVPGHDTSKPDNTFAADVLRIEFTASTVFDFTIVDLPGLVSVSVGGQIEDGDRAIKELVESYLSCPHTIILATLQATSDIANQNILQLIRKHDPKCQRTVSVLTKADRIDPGTERRIVTLANNLDITTSEFGPFLLIPSSQPHSELDFFSQKIWKENHLDQNRVGVDNLKIFLQELLEEQIERGLPKVWGEIKDRLSDVEEELRLLGNERLTLAQIRSSLTDMSMRFYRLAQAAYDGHYPETTKGFFSDYNNRLRLQVHIANEEFSNYMRDDGEKRREAEPRDENSLCALSADEMYSDQLFVTTDEMLKWITDKYAESRGSELLGNYNDAIFAELFHEQSSRWPAIARDLTRKVDKMVDVWIAKAAAEIVHENQLRRDIIFLCQKGLKETQKLAYEELEKLIDDESGPPATYNHIYAYRIQKFNGGCTKEILKPLISDAVETGWGASKFLTPNKTELIEKAVGEIQGKVAADKADQVFRDVKVALDSYYAIAMRKFVDNVCRQVIERHFMKRLPGIFCPQTVAELSDEDLLRIGSEPRKQQNRRAQLVATAQSLRESLADLQRSPI